MRASVDNNVQLFRQFLLTRRHRLQLRQQDVADRTGLSLGWVGMLEADRLKSPPRLETLQKLASGLHLVNEPPSALLDFLQMLLAGMLRTELIERVANGELDAARALEEYLANISDYPSNSSGQPLLVNQHDHAALHAGQIALLLNPERRLDRLAHVLDLLRLDLSEQDYVLAEMFLGRLYSLPPASERGPYSMPRHRRKKKGANRA